MMPRMGLLGGVVLCAFLMVGCAGKEELVHGLTEPEANQIVSVLEHKGIKTMKEREEGGRIVVYKIVVGGADAQEARKILVDNQLPRPKVTDFDKMYDPANKPLIPTATQERAEYFMALHGHIANKLRTIPGVVEAHVTIQKPERDIVREVNEKAPPATASVTITYNLVNGKTPFKIEDVQRLVAACVESLDPSNVIVLASLNQPADSLVSTPGEGGEDGKGASLGDMKVMNVNTASEADKKRLTTLLAIGGILVGVLLVAFVLALVGFLTNQKKLTAATANLNQLKKRPAAPVEPAQG